MAGLLTRLSLLNENLQGISELSIIYDLKFKVKLVSNKDHQKEVVRNVFAAHGLIVTAVELLTGAFQNMVNNF